MPQLPLRHTINKVQYAKTNHSSINLTHHLETGGHWQLGALKQLPHAFSLLLKDTNTALERQRNTIACLPDVRAQIVESLRKLLAALALTRALALCFALAMALALALPITLAVPTIVGVTVEQV